MPDFGTIMFSDTLFDGVPFGGAIGITQYDPYRGSTLQIATGPITGDQDAFKSVFKHS